MPLDQPGQKVDYALKLAEAGFSVFPLQARSKRPVERVSWPEVMTRDPEQIKEWFEVTPDANYGVCPGNRFAVIDIDTKKGDGLKAFQALELVNGELGATFTVATPSGGVHYYVQTPNPVSNSNSFPDHIDVRGATGYVVGPGCYTEEDESIGQKEGYYTVEVDAPSVEAPEWVLPYFKKGAKKDSDKDESPAFDLDLPAAIDRAREFLSRRSPAIEGYGGNDHTFATAVQVKDFGISQEQCLSLLLEPKGWNTRCDPPWEPRELAQVVTNSYKYGSARIGAKGGTLMEQFEAEMGVDPQEAPDRFGGLREITYRGRGLLSRNKRREMIVPEWLPAHGFLALLAKRGGGKSVVMLDLALRLTSDMKWYGQPTAEGWYAVYLCGEDDEGAEEQVRAWCKHHGVDSPPERFIFLEGIVDLMSAGDTQLWAEYLRNEIIGPDNRAVLFVDTWQRASARGGQNDDEDMQLAVHHVEAMAKTLRGPAAVAFHPPKHDDTVVMGSSVIENSTTAIWSLTDHAGGRRLEVSRIKGKGMGNFHLFKFNEVGLGETDDFDRERTGVVPVKQGGTEFEGNSEDDDDDMGRMREAMAEAVAELDMLRKAANPTSREFTLARAGEMLESVLAMSEDLSPEEAQVADRLAQAGFRQSSSRTLQNYLRDEFTEDPRGFKLPDGNILRAKRHGSSWRFVVEADGLDS